MGTSGAARCVHLPELTTAMGIPAKPTQSKGIGALVVNRQWPLVEEQVLADVITTTVIALMQLSAAGRIRINRPDTLLALSQKLAKACPWSKFVTGTFASWARACHAEARLKGTVYRATEDA